MVEKGEKLMFKREVVHGVTRVEVSSFASGYLIQPPLRHGLSSNHFILLLGKSTRTKTPAHFHFHFPSSLKCKGHDASRERMVVSDCKSRAVSRITKGYGSRVETTIVALNIKFPYLRY
jgi:hypothetical protein